MLPLQRHHALITMYTDCWSILERFKWILTTSTGSDESMADVVISPSGRLGYSEPFLPLWLPFINRQQCCVGNCVLILQHYINRGSVYDLDPHCEAFTTGERPDLGQWLTWFGGHIAGSHVWRNARTWPKQNWCGLILVNCELFSSGLHATPPDQRFIKVRHETWMSECTHKRLNVLLVVCCTLIAEDNKQLSKISVLCVRPLQ